MDDSTMMAGGEPPPAWHGGGGGGTHGGLIATRRAVRARPSTGVNYDFFLPRGAARAGHPPATAAAPLSRKRSAREAELIRTDAEERAEISTDNFRAHKRYISEAFAKEMQDLNLSFEDAPCGVAGDESAADSRSSVSGIQALGSSPYGQHEIGSGVSLPDIEDAPLQRSEGGALRRGITFMGDLQSLEDTTSGEAARLMGGSAGPLPTGMQCATPADSLVLYREPAAVSQLFGSPGAVGDGFSVGSVQSTNSTEQRHGRRRSTLSSSTGSGPLGGYTATDCCSVTGEPPSGRVHRRAASIDREYSPSPPGNYSVQSEESILSEEISVFPDGRRIVQRRDGTVLEFPASAWGPQDDGDPAMFEMD